MLVGTTAASDRCANATRTLPARYLSRTANSNTRYSPVRMPAILPSQEAVFR